MASVADVLGVSQKLQALDRIAQGSLNEQDFALVGEDWLLAETVQRQLKTFNLTRITFDRAFNSLSSGERTRLMLIKALLADADMLILQDNERRYSFAEAVQEYELLRKAYPQFGYQMVELPKINVKEKIQFIFSILKR